MTRNDDPLPDLFPSSAASLLPYDARRGNVASWRWVGALLGTCAAAVCFTACGRTTTHTGTTRQTGPTTHTLHFNEPSAMEFWSSNACYYVAKTTLNVTIDNAEGDLAGSATLRAAFADGRCAWTADIEFADSDQYTISTQQAGKSKVYSESVSRDELESGGWQYPLSTGDGSPSDGSSSTSPDPTGAAASTAPTDTSSSSQLPNSVYLGTVDTQSGSLNVHAGPLSTTAITGQLPQGASFSWTCTTGGDEVTNASGSTTSTWLKLQAGGYISRAFAKFAAPTPDDPGPDC